MLRQKKQQTTREFLAGGGIALVGLPLAAAAFVLALVACGVALLLLVTDEVNRGVWLLMLVVYAGAALALGLAWWRVVARSAFLLRRWRGLREEQARVAALPNANVDVWAATARLALPGQEAAANEDESAQAKREQRC